jgi:hypothetical protein
MRCVPAMRARPVSSSSCLHLGSSATRADVPSHWQGVLASIRLSPTRISRQTPCSAQQTPVIPGRIGWFILALWYKIKLPMTLLATLHWRPARSLPWKTRGGRRHQVSRENMLLWPHRCPTSASAGDVLRNVQDSRSASREHMVNWWPGISRRNKYRRRGPRVAVAWATPCDQCQWVVSYY